MMSDVEPTLSQPKIISSIGFPYVDLDDAASIARAMLGGGGVPMDRDQVAAAMGQVPTSGSFNMKLSAAKLFGLVDNAQSKFQLTPLGFEILDATREKAAKAEAFLNVPLYRKVFDAFKGRQLPPRPIGLEKAFVDFGVSPKQKDKARHAFDRSARIAGFFPSQAEDRLVQPVMGSSLAYEMPTASGSENSAAADQSLPQGVRTRNQSRKELHPFIEGLLESLPEKGEVWNFDGQINWLRAAAQIFQILYQQDKKGKLDIIITFDPEK